MGSKLFAHYSFDKVEVIVAGVPVTGFADGDDAITIERNMALNEHLDGAGGDVVNIEKASRSGVVTIKLLQTSPMNAVLSGLLAKQEAGRFDAFPIVVKNILDPAQLSTAKNCSIEGWPSQAFGAGHNAREWRILCANLITSAGGI